MAQKVIVILSGTSTWVVPSDWNDLNNRIICLAGGGGGTAGGDSNFGQPDGFGAGGGALSYSDNVALTKGATMNVGPAAAQALPQANGNNTWFGGTNYATATIRAEGSQSSAGGRAAQGVGGTKRSGGPSSGTPNYYGGGAPSLTGDGGTPTAGVFSVVSAPGGVTYSSGNGGQGFTPGSNYGGGGGGGPAAPGGGLQFSGGARGFIAIIYTPLEIPGHGFLFI